MITHTNFESLDTAPRNGHRHSFETPAGKFAVLTRIVGVDQPLGGSVITALVTASYV